MQGSFTLATFFRKFKTSDKCLEYLKDIIYPNGIFCKNCKTVTKFYKIKGRKVYQCFCGFQISPLSQTIFKNSSTRLQYWFYAIFVMSVTRSGVSAKQLQRELGISYPTAWRMFKLIRTLMKNKNDLILNGTVEIDETFIGGKGYNRGKIWWANWEDHPKQIVMGLVERNGRAYVKHIPNTGKYTLLKQIKDHVDPKAHIMTDDYYGYTQLKYHGYKHGHVRHSKKYVDGNIYVNNVEGLWSHMKRGLTGVYRHVSPKYLQSYADEYAFRYSHRKEPEKMFEILLNEAIKPTKNRLSAAF